MSSYKSCITLVSLALIKKMIKIKSKGTVDTGRFMC